LSEQHGFTLVELLVVTALAVTVMAATATFAIPMVAREAMISSAYSVQNYLQLARVEAVSRNRDCRFVVDTGARSLQVLDTLGTASPGDDEVLYDTTLPAAVSFTRPDSGGAVTLTSLGGNAFGAVFDSDGTVESGSGELVLFGGDSFLKVSLHAGGGVGLEQWSGAAWAVGS